MVEHVLTDITITCVGALMVILERIAKQLHLVLLLAHQFMEPCLRVITVQEVPSRLLVTLDIHFSDLTVELAREEHGLGATHFA